MPDLSIDNKLNLIFGIFATTTGTLGCLLAWAAWKLAYGRRERREEYDDSPPLDDPDRLFQQQQSNSQIGRGYELTLRIGRSWIFDEVEKSGL